MKHLIAALLCLFLCGCTRQTSHIAPETAPETTIPTVAAGLYDPEHPLEKEHPGLIRAYPMKPQKVHGIRAIGKDILVLSGSDQTTLTIFTGDELLQAASLTLDFPLLQDDPSLQIHESSISYYDPNQKETVVLDESLQALRHIKAPDGLSGKPIFAHEEDILYYCTQWSVVAWDLSSGIRRTLKELSYESQELTALHLEDQILECQISDQGQISKILLSADLGTQIASLSKSAQLHTAENRYFATLTDGYLTLPVFGDVNSDAKLLLPAQNCQHPYYLPEDHAAVTVWHSDKNMQLDYYELNTGILRASLKLDSAQTLKSIVNTRNHAAYILVYDSAADSDVLYRWDVLRQMPDPCNTTSYVHFYRSQESPDTAGLEQCREYARSIGSQYNITVQIGEDALDVQPWDYRFEPETLVPVLKKELQLLEKRLSQYPSEVLAQSQSHFTGLTICLVRKITGTGDSSSLASATGIQFFEGTEAYVVITSGKHAEQALYHELYHVMETHILTESTALDTWETLNPVGFSYGSVSQDTDIYLQGPTRAFVDRYSMGALKEDRARILENAILQGREDLFRSEYMQRKLHAMCTGIREAYGLKKHPQALPWEQYLVTPLAPEI